MLMGFAIVLGVLASYRGAQVHGPVSGFGLMAGLGLVGAVLPAGSLLVVLLSVGALVFQDREARRMLEERG
jgi:hypothetical protein